MMAQSFNVLKAMQAPDAGELTEEQIDQLGEVAAKAMQGVHSMAFAMGVGAPGSSIYSRTVGVFHVDDAKAYMKQYEEAMAQISKLMEEIKLPGGYEVELTQIGNTSALHITMDMSKFQMAGAAGMPNMKQFYEKMFGPGGKLSIYLAPADEGAVVMGYTSPENLLRAIKAYQAGEAGLANDAQVKKTASLLPPSAQWVGYVSPAGAVQFATQMVATLSPEADTELPKFPPSPPLGFAVELTRSHMDAQLVVPMEAIDAVMEFVVAVRQLER
jgi:predicted enzyme related to lactoylglutathione lyase